MAHMKVVRLLAALDLMPLEDISDHTEQWRQEIREAIEELQGPRGLPPDDPLRYDEDGVLCRRSAWREGSILLLSHGPHSD